MAEPLEHRWDLVDAVARSPLFESARVARGVDLARVEQSLLHDQSLPAADRERLLKAARELAEVYRALKQTDATALTD